ncbi:MAG: ABC transporter permease, partial [Planctomycetota bacterium]
MSESRARWGAIGRAVVAETRGASGRLAFFTGALAVGVAAVVGVAALVGAFEAGLRAESRTLLGGDLRVSCDRTLPPELDGLLDDVPHRDANLVLMAAVAARGEQSRLIDLKVTSGGYPFAGEPVVDPPEVDIRALGPNEAVVAPELGADLGVSIGDEFLLSGVPFTLRGFLLEEPDRVEFTFTRGPRVVIDWSGFERTDLGGKLNFLDYDRVYSFDEDLEAEALADLVDRIKAAVPDPEILEVQAHTEAQPQIRRALGQIEDFLGLVALLSLLLGGIGVSQIVRAWLAGRTKAVAVLRCLGLRANEIAAVYLGNVALLALIGSGVGAVLGALLPIGVQQLAPDLFGGSLAHMLQAGAVLRGVVLGVGTALLFSLPSLAAVWRVPPSTVLRAEAAPLPPPRLVRFGAPLLLAAGLLAVARIQGGSWLEAGSFVGGLAVLTGLLWLGARGISLLAGRIPRGRFGPYLEHGLAALARPGAGTTGAIVALGLGVMVVASMWLIESGLRRSFAEALPEDAPSVFLVDIQPNQWEAIRDRLEAVDQGALDTNPVAMARLRELDGKPVPEIIAEREASGETAWMFSRELRLTWQEQLADDNKILRGSLWSDPNANEISLEQDYAADLGVDVGSTIRMDVQGVPLELVVTSIRSKDSQSTE